MAATINVPTGSKNLMDTQKKQILTDTSNVQTSSTVGETNAKCTCGLSKNGFSFILNSKSKLKRSMSEAQSSLPRCSCAVNGRRKSHRTYSSPSKTLEILSLPVATLNTPLTSPTLDPSSLNPGHSPINNAQFASENLSFEDVFLDTPPPTYASLIRFTLLDIPPDYEAVTGIPLARDLVSDIDNKIIGKIIATFVYSW